MKIVVKRNFWAWSHLRTVFFYLLIIPVSVFGQTENSIPKNWHLLDPATDGVQGLSVERTYQTILKGKSSRTVIVAVIDSGIDFEHEDLKSVMWVNSGEIAGNGKDDDGNGYADDIHGWSFIGGKNGNINEDTYELTREYVRLSKKIEETGFRAVTKKDREELEYFNNIKSAYEEKFAEDERQYKIYSRLYSNLKFGLDTLRFVLGDGPYNEARIDSVKSENPAILFAKSVVLKLMKNAPGTDPQNLLIEIKDAYEYFERIVRYGLNKDFDPRPIVGDNYSDKKEKFYGSADVKGPDAEHGTHVAGIIAADRTNEIGMMGIADNVRIMAIRAVPNGDERDKDIANAIYYAVNNGAQIINMSFGKDYSPDKFLVDEAVRYAEKRGVLIIHAAGNDGRNTDLENNFPSSRLISGKSSGLWLEIGASSPGINKTDLVADFSNYGKKTVSFFSPGVDIYSTIPGNDYKNNSGTSMATPATSGVAAMLMSYFPDLPAQTIREILIKSTRKFDGLKVTSPGGEGEVPLTDLCITGGLINAYEAASMAMKVTASPTRGSAIKTESQKK